MLGNNYFYFFIDDNDKIPHEREGYFVNETLPKNGGFAVPKNHICSNIRDFREKAT